jgi:2-C-methyl-D-erythritol 2,4-cyclodiphosphate synthase
MCTHSSRDGSCSWAGSRYHTRRASPAIPTVMCSISDAILGAAAEDDIGAHFPDTDPTIAGIASERILAHVTALVAEKGFHIVNIDTVIVCEKPKVQPHREAIRERIASILGIGKDRVSVKGKTTERLGFTGREEGIAAYAVCLLDRT